MDDAQVMELVEKQAIIENKLILRKTFIPHSPFAESITNAARQVANNLKNIWTHLFIFKSLAA
jgi:hypothetical protein